MPSQNGRRSEGASRRGSGEPSSPPFSPSVQASGQLETPGPSAPSVPALGISAPGAPNRRSPGWYAARCLEEVEAAERRLERPSNADELVAQFTDCTSTDVGLAELYVRNNGWDLEAALQQFWRAVHPESSDDELSELLSGDSGTWEESTEDDNGDSGEEEDGPGRNGTKGPGGKRSGGPGGEGKRPRGGKGRTLGKSAKGKKRSFADENPNVDRSPAVRGRRNDSLLTITLMRNGQPFVSTYGREVDWSDASHINRLNKYRQQVFRRNLNNVRQAVVRYLPEEDQYLVDIHRAAVRANGGSSRRLSLQWDTVVEDFNARFAGRVLEGSDKPRPKRTKGSLQSQCHRIPEIAVVTGKKPQTEKQGTRSEETESPPPKRDDNDNSDDED